MNLANSTVTSRKYKKDIFAIFAKQNPQPKTELEYNNEYNLLVAIVLSAQATDISVNKATKDLFKIVDTAQKMLDLGEEGLKKYIKIIGLYNSKAKNVMGLSRQLIALHNNQIPDTVEELMQLDGVGRKTANVFLNCARGKKTIGVDTHVQRVSNRIGLVKTNNPLQTEKALLKAIPDEWQLHAHHWLILHGRYICKARKPLCDKCNITEYCNFYRKEQKKKINKKTKNA